MKPMLKASGNKPLETKIRCSAFKFCFKFNLRRYTWGCKDDRQLQQGVHYYLQKARLFSRQGGAG
jgi:hypothetical protein